MTNALILAAQVAAAAAQAGLAGCGDEDVRVLTRVEAMMHRGEDAAAHEAEVFGAPGENRCQAVALARDALRGWAEARKLAAVGGDRTKLGPANAAIADLDRLKGGSLPIEVEYAQVAIRAATAAAQDERPEMELLLTHARDLSERVARRGGRTIWPRPINVLAGELWLEVDRYDEARQAFERAARVDETPRVLVGLAESLARLERRADACQVVARVKDAAGAVLEAAERIRAACR
jgi:tetratricopeptide (TPR) repeat protein